MSGAAKKVLVGAGIAVVSAADLTATAGLLAPPPLSSGWPAAGILLGMHALASLAAGALVARLAPAYVRHGPREIVSFTACVALFIPVLGALGVALVLLRGLTEPRRATSEAWSLHDAPSDITAAVRLRRTVRCHVSAADVGRTLRRRTPEAARERFRAVLATRHLPAKIAVPLLRLAQSDPSDEVRLFAFSRLEGMRDEIERRIERLGATLESAAGEDAARLQLRLAESYWELGSSGLAEGAVLEHALKCAHRHGAIACELAPDHAAAEFFLGKVLVELRDPSRAVVAFERAERAGYPRVKLLPYRAECAFLARDHAAVRRLLADLDTSPEERADFDGVIDLWARDAAARTPPRAPPEAAKPAPEVEQTA